MNSPALLRLTGKEAEIELVNVPENAQLTSDFDIVYHDIKGVTTLPLTGISSEKRRQPYVWNHHRGLWYFPYQHHSFLRVHTTRSDAGICLCRQSAALHLQFQRKVKERK